MIETIYSTELYHHGVKGQKWGIRHDPNPKFAAIKGAAKGYTEALRNTSYGHIARRGVLKYAKGFAKSTAGKAALTYGVGVANTIITTGAGNPAVAAGAIAVGGVLKVSGSISKRKAIVSTTARVGVKTVDKMFNKDGK